MKIEHFKNIPLTPDIPLFPDAPPIPNTQLSQGDKTWSISSGGLTAQITENPYTIAFKDDKRTLTFAGYRHQAIYDIPYKWTLRSASNASCLTTDFSSNPHPANSPELVRYIHSELNLSPGELIYGLGEQFGAFVKNGMSPIIATYGRVLISMNNKQDSQSVSGIKMEEPQANRHTNAYHSTSPTATTVSSSTTRARLKSRWEARRSAG